MLEPPWFYIYYITAYWERSSVTPWKLFDGLFQASTSGRVSHPQAVGPLTCSSAYEWECYIASIQGSGSCASGAFDSASSVQGCALRTVVAVFSRWAQRLLPFLKYPF